MVAYTGNPPSCTGQSKTAGTTVVTSTNITAVAGDLILACVVADNLSANTPTVSGLNKPAGETNSWALVASADSPTATAAAGVVTHVWAIECSTSWNVAVTATLSASVTAKVIGVVKWHADVPLKVLDSVATNNTASFAFPGGLKAGEIGCLFNGREDATGVRTGISFDDGTTGTVAAFTIATSGGGAASNVAAGHNAPSATTWPNGSPTDQGFSCGGATLDGGAVAVVIGPARVVLTPVARSLATSWTTRAEVAGSLGTLWNVLENLTPVARSLATSWATRAQVAASRATSWITRAQAARSLSTPWTTRSSVAASLSTPWAVLGAVARSLSTSWATRATVARSLATSWNVDGLLAVARSLATSWTTRAQVAASRSLLWAVLTPVARSLATSWTTRISVARNLVTSWEVRAPAARSLATSWATRASIARSLATSWATRAEVARSLATSWNLGGTLTAVARSLSTSWRTDAITQVARSLSSSWETRSTTARSLATSWATRASVARSLSTTWGIRSVVAASLSTLWEVRARTSRSLSTTWSLLTSVARSLSTSWDLEGAAFGTGQIVSGLGGRRISSLIARRFTSGPFGRAVTSELATNRPHEEEPTS